MPTRRQFLYTAAVTLPAAALLSRPAMAAKPEVFSEGGLAIRGYDPVAYFTQDQAVKGVSFYTTDWNGATWQFGSIDNRDAFAATPAAYAPQYGGYCAYAVSKGATAPTDPFAWTVYEGRLYLNFSKDVRTIWQQDIPGNILKANANWPKVLEA